MPNELRRNVGLQVRKANHAVGPQRNNLVDLGAKVSADLGLFLSSTRRAHGVARDADNAALFAQQVQPFGGLFGQTDDALRAVGGAVAASCQRAPVACFFSHGDFFFKNRRAAAAGLDANQAWK